jgi:2,4-dienoyl-CoA reductase-like NADH-dependent reductase (Old Yellow Enzyme family)
MKKDLFDKVRFRCGVTMKNRFMLAPMTNTQSHEDGTLSEEEFHWLTMRAEGGFGLTMTCASHVQANGKGFPGQLGIYSDAHIPGHIRLAKAIQLAGSLAVIQLHHAGIRSPQELVAGDAVGPSAHEKSNSRALSLDEVYKLRDDFIASAQRAQQCGYNGVEIHGAHGYILCQFLSSTYNRRKDAYGGSLENRSRLLFEIVKGIRSACGSDFLIGVRLSPERFGMRLEEIMTICKRFIGEELIDFLDISLWDVFKEPEEPEYKGKSLLNYFTEMEMKNLRLTVAGNIRSAADVRSVIDTGVDFVTIGRAAILHHDFPLKVRDHDDFEPVALPVSQDHLSGEGLGVDFIEYLKKWPGFVAS